MGFGLQIQTSEGAKLEFIWIIDFIPEKNSAYFRHSSTALISQQFWSVNAMRTWSPVFVNWISDLSKIHFMFSTFYWYKSKTYSEKVKPSNKEKKIVSYFQNLNCIKTKKIIIWNICRVSHKKLCRIIFIEKVGTVLKS